MPRFGSGRLGDALKLLLAPVLVLLLLLAPGTAPAATLYVWGNSPSPASPYASWETAAGTIQAAVDAAQASDTVLVTNGVYNTGGRAVHGLMTNRVAIDKAITVRSVNGPATTWIVGQGAWGESFYNGEGAIRCVYVGTNAILSGFTLTNGHTRTRGDFYKERSGGGVWCEPSGVVTRCILAGNSAFTGGGAYDGTLHNCVLTGNSAYFAGGSYNGTLNNCTLTGNLASGGGGGLSHGTLNNCIVCFNTAPKGSNYFASTFRYSCTMPLPQGTGNIDEDPLLASATHLSALSPCIGQGSASYTSGVDLDGEPWENPPCMGADQYGAGSVAGELMVAMTVSYTNVALGVADDFVAQIHGQVSLSVWDFGDGTVVSNQPYIRHAWSVPGDYIVRLIGYNQSNPGGVSATVQVRVASQEVYHVNASSAAPAYPYASWAAAARTIQEAVDAGTQGGRLVLVTNGTYNTGGRAVYGTMTNRVVLTAGVTVQSINGPVSTGIVGQGAGGGTNNGDGAIRCVYVGNNACLSGFALTNGYTLDSGDDPQENNGGGVWCELSGVVTQCTFTGNSASWVGGGSYGGTLSNCTLTGNSASAGGGSSDGTLSNCTLTGNSAGNVGGGSSYGVLNNCTLSGNIASVSGGGSFGATLNNCVLNSNTSSTGGGSSDGTLHNCTLTGNSARNYGGGSSFDTLNHCTLTDNFAYGGGGGSFSGTLNNCSLIGNLSWAGGGSSDGTLNNCTLTGNKAFDGGGSYHCNLNNCALTNNMSGEIGGGSSGGTLSHCILVGNSAGGRGGGSYSGTLYNCTLIRNASQWGGGSDVSMLYNCTLTGNSASFGGGSYYGVLNNCTLTGNWATNSGGGSYYGSLTNCIVYFNVAPNGSNNLASAFRYSCTTPLPEGSGNIANEPMFVNPLAGDFRLLAGSPCIDAGDDNVVQPDWLDLDGRPRISGMHVDMGAYEFIDTNPPAFVGLVWATNQVPKGGTLSVSVPLALNYNPPSFQWYRNGSTLLPGQTASNLVLNAVALNDAGVYSVVVTNRNGAVTGTVLTLLVTYRMTNAAWAMNRSNFQVGVDAESGRAFWLEMCTNLTLGSWQFVTGVTNVTGWTPLLDPNPADAQRLYRLGSAPWP